MNLSKSCVTLCRVGRGYFVPAIVILLGVSLAVGSQYRKPCKYDIYESKKTSIKYKTNVDRYIEWTIYKDQPGCEIDIDDLFTNLSSSHISNLTEDRKELLISLIIYGNLDSENEMIHFTSSMEDSSNETKVQVALVLFLDNCSVLMKDLNVFKRYSRIVHINGNKNFRIYPDYDCSCLKDLHSLRYYLPCDQTKMQTVGNDSRFFWEYCEQPFEHVYQLYLEGCEGQHYNFGQALLQRAFPNLQVLTLKYANLTKFPITFPWTNVFIKNLSKTIKALLLLPKESKTIGTISTSRVLEIRASDMTIDDVKLDGSIDKIVMNNVHLKRINEQTYRHVTGLITLDLSYNDLEEIDENAFKLLKKLKYIYLRMNKLTFLPKGVFNSQRSLLVLDLSHNEIKTLSRDNFRYLMSMEDINLNFNKITDLPRDFLKDQVYSLKKLNLSWNPLKMIPIYPVYSAKMSIILISHCKINSTEFGTFIRSLKEMNLFLAVTSTDIDKKPLPGRGLLPREAKSTLDFSFNQIKYVDIALTTYRNGKRYRNLNLLFNVNMTGNPIDCNCMYPFGDLLGEIDWVCMYPMEMKGKFVSSVTRNDTYCPAIVTNCPKRCSCYKRLFTDKYVVDCRNINITRLPEKMPDGKLELWFHNAHLMNITAQEYFRNTTSFDASHNRINFLTSAAAIALTNVTSLKLDHNNLTHLPVQIMSTNIKKMTLGDNPFFCDCHNRWMRTWLIKRTSPVTDWNTIECFYNISKVKQMISVSDQSFVCHSETIVRTSEHIIFSSIVIGCTLFVLVSISLLIYFKSFTIKVLLFMHCGIHPFDKQTVNDADVEFDAFVLYSPDDFIFVQENIIDTLAKKSYTVCNLYKDLVVGFNFLHNIEQIMNKSRKVIFSMTEDCFTNEMVMSAWNLAYEKAIKDLNDSIILVVDRKLVDICEDINLKKYVNSGKFIKKKNNILQSSILYLMPKLIKEKEENDQSIEEIRTPMMEGQGNDFNKTLAYISYSDELDDQIRLKLVPELQANYDVKILEDEFAPGTDIRDEIDAKLDTCDQFIFILSQNTLQDEVKMFILSTVVSKSVLTNDNYLLLFTSGNIDFADTSQQLQNYFSTYVTASMADPDFKVRLLKALSYRRCHANTGSKC